jgi:hypothetical protein
MTKQEIISALISIEASLKLGNINDALVKTKALRRSLDALGINFILSDMAR